MTILEHQQEKNHNRFPSECKPTDIQTLKKKKNQTRTN